MSDEKDTLPPSLTDKNMIGKTVGSKEYRPPSGIAFAELRRLVEEESALDEEVRKAFLDDLSSVYPHELHALRGCLSREEKTDSDDSLDWPSS
jgi:hypothetical protein